MHRFQRWTSRLAGCVLCLLAAAIAGGQAGRPALPAETRLQAGFAPATDSSEAGTIVAVQQTAGAAREQDREAESESPFGVLDEEQVDEVRLALGRLLDWLFEHGPPIVGILLGVWLIRWLLRVGVRRLVRLLTVFGGRGDEAERKHRAAILAGLLNRIGGFLVLLGGILLILAEVGVEIAPLWTLVSAVLAMIAIGFVAVWSVVSNTLCALMLLLYQPFKVGSTIELTATGTRGTVINFNLIYTTLQSEEGDLIEVPNNTFFQQPIRHREKETCIGLDEQLPREADAS